MHGLDVSQFPYLFTYWMTSSIASKFCQMLCTSMCMFLCRWKFSTPWVNCNDCNGPCSRVFFILKKLPNCLPGWLQHFEFLPAMNKSSWCSTSLPTLGVVSILDFWHPSMCVVAFYCLHLLFPDNIWCRTYDFLFMCLYTIYISFYEVSFKVFCSHSNQFILLLGFRSSLYIFVRSPYWISLSQIYSPSVWPIF